MTHSEFQAQAWMMLVELRLAAREAAPVSLTPTRLTPVLAGEVADVLEVFLTGAAANRNQPIVQQTDNVHGLRQRSR